LLNAQRWNGKRPGRILPPQPGDEVRVIGALGETTAAAAIRARSQATRVSGLLRCAISISSARCKSCADRSPANSAVQLQSVGIGEVLLHILEAPAVPTVAQARGAAHRAQRRCRTIANDSATNNERGLHHTRVKVPTVSSTFILPDRDLNWRSTERRDGH